MTRRLGGVTRGRGSSAWRRGLVLIAAVWCLSGRVFAHELGTTRVSAIIGADRYVIELQLDAGALLAKLETVANVPRSGALDAPAYARHIRQLQQPFLAHLAVRFDGVPVQPVCEVVEPPAGPPHGSDDLPVAVPIRIRLTGVVPPRARTFTWSYALTFAAYAVTLTHPGEPLATTASLESGESSPAFDVGAARIVNSPAQIAWAAFSRGYTQLVGQGWDHLLFVLGLVGLTPRRRPMLWQVSLFTLGHALTLGLAGAGLVTLAPSVAAPLIAFSIVYVAIENVLTSELTRVRLGLVFIFGLAHGVGLAGAFGDLAVPRSEWVTGLVTFSAGVEAGQVTVIAAATLALAQWASAQDWWRRRIVLSGAASLARRGLDSTIQRMR